MNIENYTHLSGVWTHVLPETVVRGEGSYLYGESGTEYLDFTSGIGVNSTGHSHPRVAEAIAEQAKTLLFSQVNCAVHNRLIELTEELRTVVPDYLSRFFFAQSGAEAVEGAVKLAKHATGRPNVIVMQGSFHGRTHLTMAMTTSKTIYRKSYPNLPSGVFVTASPYAYASGRSEEEEVAWALSNLKMILDTQSAPEDTAAIFIEPVLGEGGYLPVPHSYMKELRKICDETGILLVADEIQSGFGRTGKMFGFQWSGIEPDIITMAKGLASGAPISAIAYREKLDARWIKGTHGGTYGGSPLGCAAAIATIKTIKEEKLVDNSLARGAELMEGLETLRKDYPFIGDVRGRGLMIGMELMKGSEPDSQLPGLLVKKALDKGLLLLSCGIRKNVLRWIPPLTVSSEEIAKGLELFKKCLEELA